MDWLRQQAQHLQTDDHWQAEATNGLINQLYGCQASLTARILQDTKGKKDKSAKITEAWLEKHKDQFEQLRSLFEKLRRAGTIELPMLVIAEQRLRNLADV